MAPKSRAGAVRAARKQEHTQKRRLRGAGETVDEDDLLLSGSSSRSIVPSSRLAVSVVVGVIGIFAAVIHTRAKQDRVSLSDAAQTVASDVHVALRKIAYGFSPCKLGDICDPAQKRPTLSDGRMSHSVWDAPRKHVDTRFENVKQLHPDINVTYLWEDPVVVYFDNAISQAEIDLILGIATPRFTPSTTVLADGTSVADSSRTSDTAWVFFDTYDPEVLPVVERLASLAGFASNNVESLGVNRYRKSQYFNFHHDYIGDNGLVGDPAFPDVCERAATVLAYLSDVEEGGETVFVRDPNFDYGEIDESNPDHLVVKPKKGRVLVWFDMHPYRELVDDRTLHAGRPVVDGEKIAATVFIRNCTRTGRYG